MRYFTISARKLFHIRQGPNISFFLVVLFTFWNIYGIIILGSYLLDKLEFDEEVNCMKKLVAFIMVLILIFSMCACNNTQLPDDDTKQSQSETNQQIPNDDDPTDTKYKLTVIDYWGYLVKPLG